jgi:Ulp1 family protease
MDVWKEHINDPIIIYESELERLNPNQLYVDCLIDFKVFDILGNTNDSIREKVFSFYCSFYHILQESRNKNDESRYAKFLRNSSQHVHAFEKDILFIPINVIGSLHWSLCIVLYPILHMLGQLLPEDETKSKHSCNTNFSDCCILHLDSYPEIHIPSKIFSHVKQYFTDLWNVKKDQPDFIKSLHAHCIRKGFLSADESDFIELVQKNLTSTDLYSSIPCASCKVPEQPNGFDCGPFILSYVQSTIESVQAKEIEAIQKPITEYIKQNLHNAKPSDDHRTQLRNTLADIAAEFRTWKAAVPQQNYDDGAPEILGDKKDTSSTQRPYTVNVLYVQ